MKKKIGKIKEYFDDGTLLYEGEYLHGKRWNGKGKEYSITKFYWILWLFTKIFKFSQLHNYNIFSAKLEYEGEFLNGKRNGKGKEYNADGVLEYEGEYLNGKRLNGKGKEYYIFNDKLKYEGEYLNGERNGKGKEYDDNGKLIFEGELLNGIRNGKGKEYYKK